MPAAQRPLSKPQRLIYGVAWVLFGVCMFVGPAVGQLAAPVVALLVVTLLAIYQRRPVGIAFSAMLVILMVTVVIYSRATFTDRKKPVTGAVPDTFPLVVVVKSEGGTREASVIYQRELEQVQKEHPDWSFLVPADDADRMRKGLDGSRRTNTLTGQEMWFPSFIVSSAGGARQRFEVYGSPDDDVTNRSEYVAEAGRIRPEFQEFYGRTVEADSLGGLAIIVLWAVITPVVLYYVHESYGSKGSTRTVATPVRSAQRKGPPGASPFSRS